MVCIVINLPVCVHDWIENPLFEEEEEIYKSSVPW